MQLLFYFLTSFFFFFGNPGDHSESSNVITVQINNIKEDKGFIRLGLYNNAKNFPITGKQYKGYAVEVKNKKATFHLYNVPNGKYAIGVLHDVNSNQVMDKTMLGLPTEPYGFSNDARATFSAPSYDDASFYHDGSTSLAIKVY